MPPVFEGERKILVTTRGVRPAKPSTVENLVQQSGNHHRNSEDRSGNRQQYDPSSNVQKNVDGNDWNRRTHRSQKNNGHDFSSRRQDAKSEYPTQKDSRHSSGISRNVFDGNQTTDSSNHSGNHVNSNAQHDPDLVYHTPEDPGPGYKNPFMIEMIGTKNGDKNGYNVCQPYKKGDHSVVQTSSTTSSHNQAHGNSTKTSSVHQGGYKGSSFLRANEAPNNRSRPSQSYEEQHHRVNKQHYDEDRSPSMNRFQANGAYDYNRSGQPSNQEHSYSETRSSSPHREGYPDNRGCNDSVNFNRAPTGGRYGDNRYSQQSNEIRSSENFRPRSNQDARSYPPSNQKYHDSGRHSSDSNREGYQDEQGYNNHVDYNRAKGTYDESGRTQPMNRNLLDSVKDQYGDDHSYSSSNQRYSDSESRWSGSNRGGYPDNRGYNSQAGYNCGSTRGSYDDDGYSQQWNQRQSESPTRSSEGSRRGSQRDEHAQNHYNDYGYDENCSRSGTMNSSTYYPQNRQNNYDNEKYDDRFSTTERRYDSRPSQTSYQKSEYNCHVFRQQSSEQQNGNAQYCHNERDQSAHNQPGFNGHGSSGHSSEHSGQFLSSFRRSNTVPLEKDTEDSSRLNENTYDTDAEEAGNEPRPPATDDSNDIKLDEIPYYKKDTMNQIRKQSLLQMPQFDELRDELAYFPQILKNQNILDTVQTNNRGAKMPGPHEKYMKSNTLDLVKKLCEAEERERRYQETEKLNQNKIKELQAELEQAKMTIKNSVRDFSALDMEHIKLISVSELRAEQIKRLKEALEQERCSNMTLDDCLTSLKNENIDLMQEKTEKTRKIEDLDKMLKFYKDMIKIEKSTRNSASGSNENIQYTASVREDEAKMISIEKYSAHVESLKVTAGEPVSSDGLDDGVQSDQEILMNEALRAELPDSEKSEL